MKKNKCKHKTLSSEPFDQSSAKCNKCGKVFDEESFFNLIDNEYYVGRMVYTRSKNVTDMVIQESLKENYT